MSYCTGRTAVITGAGSGIGRALAIELNRQGCRLFLGDINSAGLAYSSRVDACDYAEVQWLMAIHFRGVVHGTLAFLPLLQAAPRGHLINMSSILGVISLPTQSAYNASKFAVRGYTESLRQQLRGSRVHTCCVHPGGVRTNIARNSRGGEPGLSADDRAAQFEPLARTTPERAEARIIRAIERRQAAE